MKITFGEVRLCPRCGGSGKASKLNEADQKERNRQLRRARIRQDEPPPLVKSDCPNCKGRGLVTLLVERRVPGEATYD